jgi:hypothetical protein
MTKREFVQDYAGILNLLKEHAFLQYSPSGVLEYEQKQRSAVGYFVHLLFRQTGLDLPVPDFSLVAISPTDSPSYLGAKTAVKRTLSRLKSASAEPGHPGNIAFKHAVKAWQKALEALDSQQGP